MKPVLHQAFLAPLLLLWAACHSYDPEPLDPIAEQASLVARTSTGFEMEAPRPVASVPTEWFPLSAEVDLEDGLSLEEANAVALWYSPRLLRARSAARLSGIQLLQAGFLQNPELFVGPRLYEGGQGLDLPASLSFEVPYAGKRDARREKAGARFEATRYRVMEEELGVLAGIRHSFVALAALQREGELLREVAEQVAAASGWAERMQAAGEIDILSLSLIRLEQQEAEQLARDKELEAERTRWALLEAIGLLAGTAVRVQVDATALWLPPVPAPDTARRLSHPRLKTAEAEYRAAEQALRLEVARQYPDLHLGPEFESDDGTVSTGLGLRVPLPFFDRNQRQIEAAQERRVAARQDWDAALLALSREEATARSELRAAEALLAAHREQTSPVVEAAERGLQRRFESGQASVLETLAARRAVARARLREIDLERLVADAKLQAAVASGLVGAEESSGREQDQQEGARK